MIEFRDFLKEQFERGQGIKHLTRLKPIEFLEILKRLKEYPKTPIKITEKIDGAALTIGLNDKGDFFIQTARSGKIYQGEEFVKFAKERNKPLDIAKAYKDLFEFLKNYQPLQRVLRKYYSGKGFGVRGEVLWIGLAQEIKKNKIRFVLIEYDRSKIGEKLTFIPFKVLYLDGSTFEKEKDLIEDLKKISNREVKFDTPDIDIDSLDFDIIIKDYEKMIKEYKNIEEILKSRKKKDKEIKDTLIKIIQEMQRKMEEEIIQKVKRGKFGEEYEGLVIDICGKKCKIQSKIFKQRKRGM